MYLIGTDGRLLNWEGFAAAGSMESTLFSGAVATECLYQKCSALFMTRTYSAPANILFQKMQSILEDRATPLVEAYHGDFYDLDRDTLQSLFAPGMKLLWLLHPCGTHLGEVGILHPDHSHMHAAVKTYRDSHVANRTELHLIEIQDSLQGGEVNASIRQVSLDAAMSLFRPAATRYAMRGDVLTKDLAGVASIAVKAGNPLGPDQGYRTHITSERALSRLDAIAASIHARRIAADRSGQFSAELSCMVNGCDFDEIYPKVQIAPVVQGAFSPGVHARERQAA